MNRSSERLVRIHALSALEDKILIGIDETVFTVKKGGTALMTPFADKSRQRAFYFGVRPLEWRKYE